MAAGFTRLIAEHPDSLAQECLRAFCLSGAGSRAAPAALAAEGDDPDMDIWVNLEDVGFAKKFAGLSSNDAR